MAAGPPHRPPTATARTFEQRIILLRQHVQQGRAKLVHALHVLDSRVEFGEEEEDDPQALGGESRRIA